MAKYKCKVCGYIHEGNKAPDVCPVCAAPASDFEEMKDEAAANAENDAKEKERAGLYFAIA